MLNQKINIASFDRHVAESLLAMSSSGEKFKKLKCETKLFQYGREEVTFVLEQSGEEPKRFYNFDIAVKHYNEIEIPMDKPTPFPMRENKLVTDDGTPVSETKRLDI